MKNILRLSVLAVITAVFAQCTVKVDHGEASYAIAEEQAKVWTVATEQVLELIDAMPDDKLNYRPDDSIRSFAEQVAHIGQSSVIITNMFLKDIPRPENITQPNADSMTKAELKAFVKEKLDEAAATMKSMSDEQLLNEHVQSYMKNDMTRLQGMIFAHDHLTNHKAKANLYIRLAGQKPPAYHYY